MIKNFTLVTLLCIIAIAGAYSQDNLALNKATESSSVYNSNTSSYAIDGDVGTRWESESEDPQWITIDLGAVYSIDSVILVWEGAYASKYMIQVSSDSIYWDTTYTELASNGGSDTISIADTGEYIRMFGTERATVYGYSLWEFEVYGEIAESKDATLSDLTVDNTTISDFTSSTTDYYYDVVIGTEDIPSVDATTTNGDATYEVNPAENISGVTTVVVTSSDGTIQKTYTVHFVESIPNTAAPTPTKSVVDVISVYSDAYSSIYTNLYPAWGQTTVASEVQFEDNNVLKYEDLNYMGIDYTTSDVSEMEYIHLDYYTYDATELSFYVIGGSVETEYDIAYNDTITIGSWESVDIPLSYFTGPDLSAVYQVKTVGNGTVYLDNIYFWKEPAPEESVATLNNITIDGTSLEDFIVTTYSYSYDLVYGTTTVPEVDVTPTAENATYKVNAATSIPGTTTVVVISEDLSDTNMYSINFTASIPGTAAETPDKDTSNVISVYSDTYSNIYTNLFPTWGQQTVSSEIQIGSNNVLKYSDLNYMGIDYTDTNVTEMDFVHLDYFTVDATALSFYVIGGQDENAYDIATEDGITTGSWVSLNIPLTHYTAPNLDSVYQFKTVGNGTVYLDNLYFWKTVEGANTDATLSDLKINGTTISDFNSSTFDYTFELADGTTTIPTIEVTTTDTNATYVITPASELPGTTKIVVTAEDGGTNETYSVLFSKTSDLNNTELQLGAYPNPTTDYINLSSSSIIRYLQITDISGKVIMQRPVNCNNTIVNIEDYNNGLYFIQLEINNTVKTIKVLKQ